jgi:hypothetical protein
MENLNKEQSDEKKYNEMMKPILNTLIRTWYTWKERGIITQLRCVLSASCVFQREDTSFGGAWHYHTFSLCRKF